MARILAVISLLTVLVGCAPQPISESREADLGEFRLGHNIVIAPKMQAVPGSREATEEEWVTALTDAFAERFNRYEGGQLYHFGISVEGYMLAPPGVPLLASPKSAVVINVTIWDDAEARKINDEPHQLAILEAADEGALIGSGLANTREEQLANLAFNASRQLEIWLSRQHDQFGWFDAKPGLETEETIGAETEEPSETETEVVAVTTPEETETVEATPAPVVTPAIVPETTQTAPTVAEPEEQIFRRPSPEVMVDQVLN